MIDKATVEKIFDTARVEEVVGDFVHLKKRGANYMGLCPFHNEKSPSFTVSAVKGIYKCFGCGKGGNSVQFIMDHEHLGYADALRWLARKYNIEIQEKELSVEELQANNEKESLMLVSEFARKFFSKSLLESEEGQAIGLSYFKERGFPDAIIEKFQLGYSPENRKALLEAATQAGYKQEYLVKTGLCYENEHGVGDRFAGRVMFPIHNISGRPIAFGGRTLRSDKKVAKYVNSPESEIYTKSKVVYGIYQAKNAIVKEDLCYLVEGYVDVVSMHIAGVENVVASSGTSLTVEQIRLIKRYTPNITILYDGDSAGIKASFRGIDLVLEEGMNVKVLLFPDGDDPDSYSRKVSTTEFQDFIHKNAKDFIAFKTSILLADAQGDPIKKSGLIHEIVGSIALIPDPIIRSVYIKETSRLMEIDEQIILAEMNKLRRRNVEKKAKDDQISAPKPQTTVQTPSPGDYPPDVPPDDLFAPPPPSEIKQAEHQEKGLVEKLIKYGNRELFLEQKNQEGEKETIHVPAAEVIVAELSQSDIDFENPDYHLILDLVKSELEQGHIPDTNFFTRHPESKINHIAATILSNPDILSPNWEEKFNILTNLEEDNPSDTIFKALNSLRQEHLMKLKFQIQQDIKLNFEKESELQKLVADFTKQLEKLNPESQEDEYNNVLIDQQRLLKELEETQQLGLTILQQLRNIELGLKEIAFHKLGRVIMR
ncbi:MAG: DNA primase [Bacteroidia bacterium]|nr:DNA primase [Bacteroidia bacterium]